MKTLSKGASELADKTFYVEGYEEDDYVVFTMDWNDDDDEYVIDIPKSAFMINGKFDSQHVVKDAVLPLQSNEGERFNGVVVEVKDDVVVIDLNHPMAGCELHFVGEVLENREASPQEYSQAVNMLSGGGCGGGCGSCGGCGSEGGCHCEGNCDC